MSDIHLSFDPKLGRANTFTFAKVGRCIAIHAKVRLASMESETVFFCRRYGRNIPHDRVVPNLARLGEHEWRVEPCEWPEEYSLPPGVAIILTGWDGVEGD